MHLKSLTAALLLIGGGSLTVSAQTPVILTTASGTNGADSYNQLGAATTNFGTQTSVVTKYTGADTGTTNRKIYLRFDTASLQKPSAAAKLDLTVALNNGGSTNTTPQNFVLAVYGLNNGTTAGNGFLGEDWGETELNWNNAPANIVSGAGAGNAVRTGTGTADGGQAVLLGAFNISATQTPGVLAPVIEGQSLVDFLNADTNGHVTFIITRTGWSTGGGTPAPTQGGANLGFHSKEATNPAFAPTLTVTPGATVDFRILSIAYPTAASGALITWRSVIGRSYRIETSTDGADWTIEVVDGWPQGGATGDTASYEDTVYPAGSPNRFYRVVEE